MLVRRGERREEMVEAGKVIERGAGIERDRSSQVSCPLHTHHATGRHGTNGNYVKENNGPHTAGTCTHKGGYGRRNNCQPTTGMLAGVGAVAGKARPCMSRSKQGSTKGVMLKNNAKPTWHASQANVAHKWQRLKMPRHATACKARSLSHPSCPTNQPNPNAMRVLQEKFAFCHTGRNANSCSCQLPCLFHYAAAAKTLLQSAQTNARWQAGRGYVQKG